MSHGSQRGGQVRSEDERLSVHSLRAEYFAADHVERAVGDNPAAFRSSGEGPPLCP